MVPTLYSPNEPEHFLGFFTSWIRIRICQCGSRRNILIRIHADPDPKRWFDGITSGEISCDNIFENRQCFETFIVHVKKIILNYQPSKRNSAKTQLLIDKKMKLKYR